MNQWISEEFLQQIEVRLSQAGEGRRPFSEFLEDKMDEFDYSNTSLAKKVFHKVYRKKEGKYSYVPVTRQAIGTWLRGSMPSSREIYVTLGMAFAMSLEEINRILLETYMGYGLYCKNIEDALWIALINGLFSMEEFDSVKESIEEILAEEPEDKQNRSLPTIDLWELLSATETLEDFYRLIREYREEFRNGARQFGIALNEVIEEEYGYYEKASWFLRDIGCLHCEAQFSKIRAGKAVVTRDWLLRFCIALHPSIESIEKLLAKAQMEPLGITPTEIIIEMISKEQADLLANSQEMWILIESLAQSLQQKGYEIDEDLCRKYDAVYDMTTAQKIWFVICLGESFMDRQKKHDFGYQKKGYCRYHSVDEILFDEVNKCKKSTAFKEAAKNQDGKVSDFWQVIPALAMTKDKEPDPFDLEKFEDYCYDLHPSRFSDAFLMNDVYYFCSLAFSVFTGKCFVKNDEEILAELDQTPIGDSEFASMLRNNLAAGSAYDKSRNIRSMLGVLYDMKKKI